MKYHFNDIEAKWQKRWAQEGTFKSHNDSEKPKYYVLDMFPYPSGAGLHVGHPLGYIASDIYARYKRHKGFNVLHPQGYDSFGLPAEQYAIQTGQHPAITTKVNIEGGVDNKGNGIEGYRKQLDRLGLSFDWSREVRTSDPQYYKWTQWIFTQLFDSWYCKTQDKAKPITELVAAFSTEGNANIRAACDDDISIFDADFWNTADAKTQEAILLKYRLTYLAETEVNWCPALGTVLANDEIVNGVSERGGHPVIRKKMTQWSMRISAYAERLLEGLNRIDWTESLKESQRNWIGKSVGAHVEFGVQGSEFRIGVFTTRPDTIFGVSFITLAPEHELVAQITTPEQKTEVDAYIEATAKRSERDRMADVKTISGVFTGAYAEHPFTKTPIPIWIGDYVLANYGTGAVMAVPCGDQRDYDFAKHFDIDIPNVFKDTDISEAAFADKSKTIIANSDFLDGLSYKEAVIKAIEELEAINQGYGKTNYRLRDAVFSRQRYWGEPFPVYYKNGMPQMIDLEHLPLELPEVEKYLPTEEGEPPLGRADVWAWDTSQYKVVSNQLIDNETIFPLELNTMPGWAGSSYYFNRYMDPHNRGEFVSKKAVDYWENIDLYIGGSEHATGHLLYARFWQKFLFDRGYLPVDEFAKKLINQGMILGESAFVYVVLPMVSLSSKYADNKDALKLFRDLSKKVLIVSKQDYEDLKLNGVNEKIDKWYFDNFSQLDFEVTVSYMNDEQVNAIKTNILVDLVDKDNVVDKEGLKSWIPRFNKAEFLDDKPYICYRESEKMSKSKYNVVNPDDICAQYGADTLRMYEMFLGPLEQAKPWNTAGITGVHSFLKKLWKLYHSGTEGTFQVTDGEASPESLKTLHKTIKKVEEDIENFSFNTSVSTFMIAVNDLSKEKCTSHKVLAPLAILISPYAPHIAEELWEKLGHKESISYATFPVFEEKYLVESTKTYPISFNGKMRFTMDLSLDLSKDEIETVVMAHEKTVQYLEGRTPKKVIVVPGKIVNIVG